MNSKASPQKKNWSFPKTMNKYLCDT